LLKAFDEIQKVQQGIDSGLSEDLLAIDIRQALYHFGEITSDYNITVNSYKICTLFVPQILKIVINIDIIHFVSASRVLRAYNFQCNIVSHLYLV
jgi:hypothetical protein